MYITHQHSPYTEQATDLDNLRFEFWRGQDFSLRQKVKTISDAHTACYSMGTRILSRLQCLGHKVDDSLPSSGEVKIEWIYTPAPPIRFHSVNRNNYAFSHNTPHSPQQVLSHKVITSGKISSINTWYLINNLINYTQHTIVVTLHFGIHKCLSHLKICNFKLQAELIMSHFV